MNEDLRELREGMIAIYRSRVDMTDYLGNIFRVRSLNGRFDGGTSLRIYRDERWVEGVPVTDSFFPPVSEPSYTIYAGEESVRTYLKRYNYNDETITRLFSELGQTNGTHNHD